ncbi:MAG TPA: tetratricopeptide repeat protein [Terriglobia bacterium]
MARLTRHELKTDEFQSTVESFEQFARENARQITTGVAAAILVAAAVIGWRTYNGRQEAAANAALAEALKTYKAEVNAAPVNLFSGQTPPAGQFSTPQDKYKAALAQFSDVVAKYPRQTAADFARYHVGLCQALLGNDAAAEKTLEAASHSSDNAAAALASMALAGELAKTGKLAEAAKIYQKLADHPTSTVPRATALLAEADLLRSTQPAQARALYETVQKEFSSDAYLSSTVRQQIASLPK